MLRKLLFLLLSVCSTYICVGNPYADDFESVTPDQGLADPVIYCFAQDPQGYIWIGTKGGLTRYDGYRFTTYTHTAGDTTSLSHSRINCLMADGDTIYIGTDRGLNLYDIRTGKIRQLLNTQNYYVILEESYNLFRHRRFGRMAEIWVTNWQPCLFLRFALSCLTRPLVLRAKIRRIIQIT